MQHQQQICTDIERNLHSYIHFLPVTCSINFHCSCHFIHTILSYFLSFSSSNTVFYFFSVLSKYKNVLCVWNISKEKKQIQLFTWFLGYTFADRMMIKQTEKQKPKSQPKKTSNSLDKLPQNIRINRKKTAFDVKLSVVWPSHIEHNPYIRINQNPKKETMLKLWME